MSQDHQALQVALSEAVSRGQARVPPYPSTALALQAVLARDDYAVEDLVAAMRTDQAFTGNLLRLANSPMYRRGTEATSVTAAVLRIGARELTRLAMAAAISHAVTQGRLTSLRRRVWRESLAGALISETLAQAFHVDPAEAFVAGLLHDVGKLVALNLLEDLLPRSPAVTEAQAWEEVERVHVALGAVVAQRWQLPGVLGAVVCAHHDGRERSAPLTATVLKADEVVALLERQPHVSRDDVAALGVPLEVAEAVVALLTKVPAFLKALDSPEARPTAAPKAPLASQSSWLCVERVGDATGEVWPVRHFDDERLVASATEALMPGSLVEFSLSPTPLTFWGVVLDVKPEGDRHAVAVRPFALSHERAAQWRALSLLRAQPQAQPQNSGHQPESH
jgi:putative nucleotidyltransferase with HDIG domain